MTHRNPLFIRARQAVEHARLRHMTADEIAAQAGVSPASVRRVLDWTTANRGNGRVSTATLEKLAGVR